MANDKRSSFRYKILDECFRRFESPLDRDNLLREVNLALEKEFGFGVGIGVDQLTKDIDFMRRQGAPIYCDKKGILRGSGNKPKYFYRNSEGNVVNYTFNYSQIPPETLDTLNKTIELLQAYQEIPAYGWLKEISQQLNIELNEPKGSNYISFDKSKGYSGLRCLSELIQYTLDRQPLLVKYVPSKRPGRSLIFHPYHMKEYDGSWYIWGLDRSVGRVIRLNLEFIESISTVKEDFIVNESIDFRTYFDNVIGPNVPSHPAKVETFVLKFSPRRFEKVKTKPIHSSQREHPVVKHAIKLRLIENEELDSIILSFGSDVEVVEPLGYREKIAGRIKKMLENY